MLFIAYEHDAIYSIKSSNSYISLVMHVIKLLIIVEFKLLINMGLTS